MARVARIILMMILCVCPAYADTLRVVSLYPGHSENIFALGGSDMLIAVSENDDENFMPELPRVSLRSGAERILAMKPDMVITRSFAVRLNPNLYDVLERSGVKVLTLDPPDWDNFPEYLKTLAEELNLDAEFALSKLDYILSELKAYAQEKSGGKRPRVFLEATSRELHTCSPNSWAARLIELAGGVNIAAGAKPLRDGSAIASWGVERVLENAENIDVYIIQNGAMNTSSVQDFRAREWSKALEGVKVVEIPERYLSRPTIFGLELGGNELIKIFWGE